MEHHPSASLGGLPPKNDDPAISLARSTGLKRSREEQMRQVHLWSQELSQPQPSQLKVLELCLPGMPRLEVVGSGWWVGSGAGRGTGLELVSNGGCQRGVSL